MVICIVALAIFSILGLFSAYYKRLAKEAFSCVSRMLIFQPCKTNLDQRIKSKVTTKLMKVPPLAKFFYKNFKVLSWIFTISFFVSMAYSLYGIYNLLRFGTCQPGSVCVINQGASQISQGFSQLPKTLTCYEAQIVYAIVIIAAIILVFIKYLNVKFKKN